MPDGDFLIIGQDNEGTNTTRLTRQPPGGAPPDTTNIAFEVINENGVGIAGIGNTTGAPDDPLFVGGVTGETSKPGAFGVSGLNIDDTSDRSVGVIGRSVGRGRGVEGLSPAGNGVVGSSRLGFGVAGVTTQTGPGLVGLNGQVFDLPDPATFRAGVLGHVQDPPAPGADGPAGVVGLNGPDLPLLVNVRDSGVYGESRVERGRGVRGISDVGNGVEGTVFADPSVGGGAGVRGFSEGAGVAALSVGSTGLLAFSRDSVGADIEGGLIGTQTRGTLGARSTGSITGVVGRTTEEFGAGFGVSGRCATGRGVFGEASQDGDGVYGQSEDGNGVVGESQNGLAGFFLGDVRVTGLLRTRRLRIDGSPFPLFTIDHPLDPANKYLNHTTVKSEEMRNFYDGVTELDQDGTAWVELPEWCEELNSDFRYQLTAIGAPATGLYIAEEISYNRFKVAGGEPGMKVSWQVCGIQRDTGAEATPIEEEKTHEERGYYMHPELYGQPEERGLDFQQRLRVQQLNPQSAELPEADLSRLDERRRGLIEAQQRGMEEERRTMEEQQRRIEEQQRGREEHRRRMEEQQRHTEALMRQIERQEEPPGEEDA